MTAPVVTPCAACGTPGSGRFCSSCGAPLGAARCGACHAELSAGAQFCHRCGTPVAARRAPGAAGGAARPEKTAWIVAGALVLFLVGMVAYRVVTGQTAGRVPDMANAGNAAPVGAPGLDPGGSLPTGQAPDISSLTPEERFIRLNNRVMEAAGRGDTATVVNFTPMALGAYAQLPAPTNDDRYHAAVLQAQVGRIEEALALTDTMLAATPGYLLAYVVRGDVAELRNDQARLRGAFRDFLAAYEAESRAARAEYVDHRNVLDEFLQRARSAP
ncbi:MAG TPA: zinc-ribbon domain-containing protein [Gemmatimonadales bacterium]